jgi:hypothetical protein
MIELANEAVCSIEEWSTYLDFKCPCIIPFNDQYRCALEYSSDEGLQTEQRCVEGEQHEAIVRPAGCILENNGPTINLSAVNKLALIDILHIKWIEYLRFHPSDRWLNTAMIAYPEDPPGAWPVILIPVCKVQEDQVQEIYTAAKCFTPAVDCEGPPVFAIKGILEFLQAYHVQFIVGTVDCWNFELNEQEGLPLCMVAFKASPQVGDAFAYFVNRYGGSLRPESRRGWCIFESE